MAKLSKIDDNNHYKITELRQGEDVECPDGITRVTKLDEDTIKLVVFKGKIVSKLSA